jgi:DNA-binding transcriptional LysR family regulator
MFDALATELNSAMKRSDLADLNAFVVVANHLSFRAAAAQLEVSASALSHSMRQLEERHGVRLLNRTTRNVSLTDAGIRLLEQLRPAIDQISGALETLNQRRKRPFGRLRIHATQLAAIAAVAPMWGRFASTYPDVHLEIFVETRPIDIVASGFDAGIGLKEWAAADMVAVRVLGPMKAAVVGSPEYFERRHPPRTIDDLASHSCIQYRSGHRAFPWSFERNGKMKRIPLAGAVTVNDPYLSVRAALDGLGLAYTVEPVAEPFLRTGQLVRVLERSSPHLEGLFLYYPARRQMPAALRAFIDMIRAPKSPWGGHSLQLPFLKG